MAEEKRDGIRALWIDDELLTREGHPIGGTDHIRRALERIERREGVAMFFDGEFQLGESFADTQAHFARRAGAADNGTLWLFDAMPLADWQADECELPLYSRKRLLADMLERDAARDRWEWDEGSRGRPPPCEPVRLLADTWLFDPADVDRAAREIWARGGEGLMLKDAESIYRRDRSASWLKVKQDGWSTRKAAWNGETR